MTASIETGLFLLVVGMLTVFAVLGVVVFTGRALILVVNRLPGTEHTKTEPPAASQTAETAGAKIAAITAAVHSVTGGRGQITNIERLD